MADLSDGIANVTALTAQINQLKESAQTASGSAATTGVSQADINNSILNIEKGFSELLDDLISSSDSEKTNKDKYDPFAAIESYYQQTAGTGTTNSTTGASSNATAGTSSIPNANIAPSSATDPSLNYINVPDLDLTI